MQVGEIRPATVDDFKQLLDIVLKHDGWDEKPDKNGVKVWTKSDSSTPVKMIKLFVDFKDVSALTLYDVLHDPNYRSVWDESMIEGLDIYKIDEFNDIGYYSLRCPPPLKNRDFVNQRSWGIFGDDHMIMNHTIDIEEMPVRKNFVRGVSYLTGYVVRAKPEGCSVYYITQNDPGGQVPKWILNRISSVIAPKVLEKIHAAAVNYENWKGTNSPEWRPWRGIGEDNKPVWPRLNSTLVSNSTPTLQDKHISSVSVTPNGIVENDTPQFGSLDSLPQKVPEGSVEEYSPVPQQTEEIIGNVFNIESREDMGNSEEVPWDEMRSVPSKPPLLRHESITVTFEEEHRPTPESKPPGMTKQYSIGENSSKSKPENSNIARVTRTDMLRGESLDNSSQISDLCHSISKLTTGYNHSNLSLQKQSKESFASITIAAHPIDPDCCTRVSRNVLGIYGARSRNTSSLTSLNSTAAASRKPKHHINAAHAIPEVAKLKKTSNENEGLESSTLKFLSKVNKHHQKQRGNKHRAK